MEYFLILILQAIGIGLHVMQKMNGFDKANPDKTKKEVWKIFWDEDANTVVVSGLVALLNLVVHFIIYRYATHLTHYQYYYLIAFALAFMLGYFGQRKIYQWLGTAEKALDKRVDKILN